MYCRNILRFNRFNSPLDDRKNIKIQYIYVSKYIFEMIYICKHY